MESDTLLPPLVFPDVPEVAIDPPTPLPTEAEPTVFPEDTVPVPAGSIGPTFSSELEAAGVANLAFSYDSSSGLVTFASTISAEGRAKVIAVMQAHDPSKPPEPPHATECFPAQGEIALYQTGHYEAYQEAVANSTYVPLKIYVQKASKWEIGNPYIQAMQAELGLSDDQVQALFDLAVTL